MPASDWQLVVYWNDRRGVGGDADPAFVCRPGATESDGTSAAFCADMESRMNPVVEGLLRCSIGPSRRRCARTVDLCGRTVRRCIPHQHLSP